MAHMLGAVTSRLTCSTPVAHGDVRQRQTTRVGMRVLGSKKSSAACGDIWRCIALPKSITDRRSRAGARNARLACNAVATTETPTVTKATAGQKTAVVVGAGVGGLTMAGRLARAGYKVTLLEKNVLVGGRMQSYNPPEAPDYRFDTGPSLLLFPEVYKKAFAALGAKMSDHVEIARVEPAAYRAHYGDGTKFDLVYDMEVMRRQVEEFEPGAGGMFVRFLGTARASLDLGVAAFIEQDSTTALDFINPKRILKLALAVNPLELLLPQIYQMKNYFKSPKLIALFSFQQLYVGLTPYTAPGVFSLLAATELTDGVWYPIGGFQKIRDAFLKLAVDLGVHVRTQTDVDKIIVVQDGDTKRATGVRLRSGELLEADVIVANPDIPFVYQSMMEADALSSVAIAAEAARMDKLEYSCGVIAYNWCLQGQIAGLLQHNVFLGSDYKASWVRPWEVSDFDAPKQPNFYVHNPSYTDKTCAPEGCDSVMILMPVANFQEAADAAKKAGREVGGREEMVAAGKAAIERRFTEMGFGDVGSMIKHEFVIDPEEWATRYNIKNGAVFGLSHGLLQLACFRPPTQTGLPATPWWADSPKIENLYFVGASTRPGNGVPLVMMGVAVQFDNIIRNHGVGVMSKV